METLGGGYLVMALKGGMLRTGVTDRIKHQGQAAQSSRTLDSLQIHTGCIFIGWYTTGEEGQRPNWTKG